MTTWPSEDIPKTISLDSVNISKSVQRISQNTWQKRRGTFAEGVYRSRTETCGATTLPRLTDADGC
jgi:hypothetical protein